MKRIFRLYFLVGKKLLVGVLLFVLAFFDVSILFQSNWAEAAETTIDASTTATATEELRTGYATVFISDQVGYRFYVDLAGTCVYSKTTNGGAGWGAAVTVDSQTDCTNPTVWYDQWTPSDTGTYIHIVTQDPGNDDLWYNRLDTSSDTRLLGTTPVSVVTNSGQGGALAGGTTFPAITKATDGDLYIGTSAAADGYVVTCTATCETSTNWTEVGTNPFDADNDIPVFVPLAGGDIMIINRDISLDDIRYKTWTGSWSSWNTFDSNAPENATFDGGISALVNIDSGDVYVAYVADNATLGTDDDIRTYKYAGGSWTAGTNVLTNSTLGLTNVSIGMDYNTSDLYVAYAGRTTPGTANTARVYWQSSTDDMVSWGGQQGPVDASTDEAYGLSLNGVSDERIHVSWYESTPDDVLGDTIANIAPAVRVTTSGTQTTPVRADSANRYIGGKFIITENLSSRNVTDITVTESGGVDAANDLTNIKLQYDLDTSAPYDCASESYGGSESQFGSTDTNGFSGTNGISSFTGSVTISTTQTMCVYTVLDIKDTADNNSTLDVEISNPNTDVSVSGGVSPLPKSVVALSGATTIVSPNLTQTHYHWRNDNGTETTATSRTGGTEDTALAALQKTTPVRLRLGVSNEGSTTTLPTTFRLEYATSTGSCSTAAGWTDVNAASDAWDMSNSANLTEGANTTNISVGSGGVTDENSSFLSTNGGVRDTSSQTGSLTLGTTNWVELEYSIVPTSNAVEGTTYCFRATEAGDSLQVYTNYPQVTISADVTVSATGTQTASTNVPTDNVYIGGAFTIRENSSSRSVTSIKLTETGTVNGLTGLADIRLYYDLDTSAPYDCAGESYAGTENRFGATSTAFTADNGTSTFSGSVTISTTQTMCVYTVLDVTTAAQNAQTVDVSINSGSSDVVVSGGGSVSPSSAVDITSSTTLNGAVVTQTHYHWRNDNGSEAAATSATGGTDDTVYTDMPLNSPIRLRFGLSNEGAATSVATRYRIEYGIKQTSCSNVSVWEEVGTGISWNMYDSSNLTNAGNTTNIAEATGGVADENTTFLSSNGGVRDTEALSGTTTLTTTEHTDLEYSITTTVDTPYETTYCFRLTASGIPLLAYTTYPEVTTVVKRDYFVQRGESTLTGTGLTLTAGVNYIAPSASTTAFVRITNMYHTGAGNSTAGNTQNTDDVTAYINNPGNIATSFTISRPSTAINNTRVTWEIVEFVGDAGTDNEMIVRDQQAIQLGSSAAVATGTAVSSVSDDADVVVYITGIRNANTGATLYNAGQVTARWNAATNQPIFDRGVVGAIIDVSYAVVEYTGVNWKVQRVEHTYGAVGTTETENITAVNSLSRTFLHTQKRLGALNTQVQFGHEVWLSSIGAVSFFLPSTASSPSSHVSVAWIIENTQTNNGAMLVQRKNGTITGGAEPRTTTVTLTTDVDALNNSSVFAMSTQDQATTNFPRVLGAVYLNAVSSFQIWNSDNLTTANYNYRAEVVEWPVADLVVRQNYFRHYVDNNALLPTDPWPAGATDLGENQAIGSTDEPLADGENIRVRLSLRIANASMPAGYATFKLQYGVRDTSCSAISTWNDVGSAASSTIWRSYNATSVADGAALSGNPPASGDVILSVSDRAGRYSESNPTVQNPFAIYNGEDAEFDWNIQQNGATQRTTYCFRMVYSDGTTLDSYLYYPQIRTEGFTPVTQAWRWYNDESSLTPLVAFAAESVTPTDIEKGNTIKLRVAVAELKNLAQSNARFKLQYSEDPTFTTSSELVATSSCVATSTWCYADGAGVDNAVINAKVISEADSCAAGVGDGCGTHNESSQDKNGYTHVAGAVTEYEFTLQYTNVPRNYGRLYYFRLFDVKNNDAVAVNTGYTYPSVVVEPTRFSMTLSGLPAATSTGGIVTDIVTTATAIPYGDLPTGTNYEGAQRMLIATNAEDGYQVFLSSDGELRNQYSTAIGAVAGTNAVPTAWATGCPISATGCFGYHSTDDVLLGGSTRFAPIDTYAAATTTQAEVFYTSTQGTTTHDIVYRTFIRELQPAGDYTQALQYTLVPVF